MADIKISIELIFSVRDYAPFSNLSNLEGLLLENKYYFVSMI